MNSPETTRPGQVWYPSGILEQIHCVDTHVPDIGGIEHIGDFHHRHPHAVAHLEIVTAVGSFFLVIFFTHFHKKKVFFPEFVFLDKAVLQLPSDFFSAVPTAVFG